ncbi:MAG: MBL fold metallo-hydrolase [Planctomycetota bacterium]|nr:MAG: MBL fold metallo-hydrolase [Planctomycetota bacterium]
MILKQYYLACLSHASYLIADEGSASAVVIDPQRDIDQYLHDAKSLGVKIRHVLLTHFHADFVAGHLELQQKTGANIYLGRRGQAEYPAEVMQDGGSLALGKLRFDFLETPGHTPEGISIVLSDESQVEAEPHAVFTGDTLFIGDVGRPDLLASVGVSAEALAGMLYDSLHDKLMKLPDSTLVYPAHGAGSLCGKSLSQETVSTIGEQRRLNYALQSMSREAFIEMVSADQPPAPAYFPFAANLNREVHPTLDQSMEAARNHLTLEAVLQQQQAGAQLLDTRDPETFAAGHIQGSLNVGLGGKFATWAGSVLDRQRPIVVLADPGRSEEAVMRLGRIGLEPVAGVFEGVEQAMKQRPELLQSVSRYDPDALRQRLGKVDPPIVLDVRQPGERQQSQIEGSLFIPLGQLGGRLDEVPQGREVVMVCAGGYRSMIAASVLQEAERHGRPPVETADLRGGMGAWLQQASTC